MRGRKKQRGVQSGARPLGPAAWMRLYADFYPQVRSWFVARVASEQDADDLAEQVLAELARGNAPDHPKAYILGMASKALSRYRRRRARERTALPRLLREIMIVRDGQEAWGPGELPRDEESTAERDEIMEDLLGGLTPDQVRLLKLRFVEGLGVAEVARRVGCSTEAAYKQLQRIIRQVRRKHGVARIGRKSRQNKKNLTVFLSPFRERLYVSDESPRGVNARFICPVFASPMYYIGREVRQDGRAKGMKPMVAGWIGALERRHSGPRGGAAGGNCQRSSTKRGGWTAVQIVTAAGVIWAALPVAARSADRDPLEKTVAGIRECMARSPAPWPEAWRKEYGDAIRQVIALHQEAPQYATRLEIVCKGFPPYWEGLKKGRERSLFEVHRAQIRWYVESLMSAELPGKEDQQELLDQYKSLWDYATSALLTQFPFLDPNMVNRAKADHIAECYRAIESPLLPAFLHPLSEDQVRKIKRRWHDLRYARVDLWGQLGGDGAMSAKEPQMPPGNAHPHYLLTQRSLIQWRAQMLALAASPPDYYRDAVRKDADAERGRLQLRSEARTREERLGMAVLQTEYLSFLLAALLETAEIPENAIRGLGEGKSDGLLGEIHEEP